MFTKFRKCNKNVFNSLKSLLGRFLNLVLITDRGLLCPILSRSAHNFGIPFSEELSVLLNGCSRRCWGRTFLSCMGIGSFTHSGTKPLALPWESGHDLRSVTRLKLDLWRYGCPPVTYALMQRTNCIDEFRTDLGCSS